MHETGNVGNEVSGEICGGVDGILLANVVLEKEDEDGLGVSIRDIRDIREADPR